MSDHVSLQLHLVSLLVLHVKSPRPSGTPLRKGGINLSCEMVFMPRILAAGKVLA
jgi:hypothetical protein